LEAEEAVERTVGDEPPRSRRLSFGKVDGLRGDREFSCDPIEFDLVDGDGDESLESVVVGLLCFVWIRSGVKALLERSLETIRRTLP